ncbi:MAG: VOC family protein [Synergistaceae bacterium]|nr:VOC family protein [Synergistaceae bacterium]
MKIEHVAVYVNDLEAAKNFFVKYFEAETTENYYENAIQFRSYFLTFPDGGARLELMTKPGMTDDPKGRDRTGYIHIALSVGSKEKVDSLTARLKEDGYRVESGPRTTGDGYYESCIIGIEGNQVEITV